MSEPTLSLEQAYRLADIRMDSGDKEAARLLNYAAGMAEQYNHWLQKFAWAALEKNARKRRNTLTIVLMEMENHDLDMLHFPMRSLLADKPRNDQIIAEST